MTRRSVHSNALRIKSANRSYFESQMAEAVRNVYSEVCPDAVNKISENIIALIHVNRSEVIDAIRSNVKITHELYSKTMSGSLRKDPESNPNKILEDIVSLLKSKSGKHLPTIMHIHSLFAYRIYPTLSVRNLGERSQSNTSGMTLSQLITCSIQSGGDAKDIRDHLKSSFLDLDYFKDRGRLRSRKKQKTVNHIGFADGYFKSRIKDNLPQMESHSKGSDEVNLDVQSPYYQRTRVSGLPYVSGPSGHTKTFLEGAFMFGDLSDQEMKAYLLAVFAYLALGGHHSFHEVYSVASVLANVPYDVNNYAVSLPESFKESDAYRQLRDDFDQYCYPQDRQLPVLNLGLFANLMNREVANRGHYVDYCQTIRGSLNALSEPVQTREGCQLL